MKKNAMLKIAAILMVAVLLTTCAISSTFAKYATTVVADRAEARVAKWGVGINATVVANDTTGMFLKSYEHEGKQAIAVEAIVAPGTKRSLTLDGSLTGQPEVSGQVVVTATFTADDKWFGEDLTCPVVITDHESATHNFTSGDRDIEITKIFPFAAGQDLSDLIQMTVGWEWAFTRGTSEEDKAAADAMDTAFGQMENAPMIYFDLKFDVVQTGSAVQP